MPRGCTRIRCKSAGFGVLKAPDVPSVLVELGYVTNKQDLKALTSEAWRGTARGRGRAGGGHIFHHPAGRRPELSAGASRTGLRVRER